MYTIRMLGMSVSGQARGSGPHTGGGRDTSDQSSPGPRSPSKAWGGVGHRPAQMGRARAVSAGTRHPVCGPVSCIIILPFGRK